MCAPPFQLQGTQRTFTAAEAAQCLEYRHRTTVFACWFETLWLRFITCSRGSPRPQGICLGLAGGVRSDRDVFDCACRLTGGHSSATAGGGFWMGPSGMQEQGQQSSCAISAGRALHAGLPVCAVESRWQQRARALGTGEGDREAAGRCVPYFRAPAQRRPLRWPWLESAVVCMVQLEKGIKMETPSGRGLRALSNAAAAGQSSARNPLRRPALVSPPYFVPVPAHATVMWDRR